MTDWFIPEMEEFVTQRALLNLNLNKAIRHYRELVAPGIGGVWFVRQMSWAVAGIQLAQEINSGKPVKIANAIEALACKLAWCKDQNQGVRGKRAFNKDKERVVWSFKELSQPQYYVRIPFRSSTVRALSGLGLTTGTRFNSMVLTQNGSDLAEAFLNQKKGGQGGKSVRKAITDWIGGDKIGNIVSGLWRDGVTDEEKEISRNRLMSNSNDSFGRRAHLIEAFGNCDELNLDSVKKNLHPDQVIEIETAQAFDGLLKTGRDLIHKCAEIIDEDNIRVAGRLADRVDEMLEKLRSAANRYQECVNKSKKPHHDARDFTEICSCDSDEKLLLKVIERDGVILKTTEENTIEKGHLFSRHKEISENGENERGEEVVGTEESSTELKIRQLFKLRRDCQ
ncbi:MAG: hypothetical protein FJ266_10605 [Planctomycetes bacterium]|nr:hypothetical protein [Planctomycetota bacterium]